MPPDLDQNSDEQMMDQKSSGVDVADSTEMEKSRRKTTVASIGTKINNSVCLGMGDCLFLA